MPKNLRIVTSSFATLEDVLPPFNLRHPNPDENIRLAQSILETAAGFQPDLVLLPETFKLAGISARNIPEIAEPIDGPTFRMLADNCRKGRFNLVAGHLVSENDRIYNQALIIDREGNLIGSYRKNYPVDAEISCGVTPGHQHPVFDLDCARIGVAICFDINWPNLWSSFNEQQVDLACWISAYEGGFPLKSYAWVNQYPIVSSVFPYHARVIDVTGEVLASTSRWSRVAAYDLNLDRVICHTDGQMDRVAAIQKKYGDTVRVKTFTEEHLMIIENMISGQTIQDIIQEFDLVSYRDYIAKCTMYREAYLKNNAIIT